MEDASKLNVLEGIHYPKATDHISNMIELIEYLLEKNYAYITLNGIYFEVKKFSQYGKLSKKTSESIDSGARVRLILQKKIRLILPCGNFPLTRLYGKVLGDQVVQDGT